MYQSPRARVVIINRNKVLLIHRFRYGQEYFVFPGGGIEKGETPEQAAQREVKEETDPDIEIKRLLLEFDNRGTHEYYFLAMTTQTEVQMIGEELDRMNKDNQFKLEWHAIVDAVKLPNLYPVEVQEELKKLADKKS